MATDKELSGFIVNEVESDDKLSKISQEQTLDPNQIFVTKDGTISDNAVGLPIGAIFASAIPITDARVHLLDGSYISQDGVYQEFATLIKSLDASGQPITCTEKEFEDDLTLTGNCGKFVINNSTGTIRLPKITTFIQGLGSITDIGKSLESGLPNITGEFGMISNSSRYLVASNVALNGVFTPNASGGTAYYSTQQTYQTSNDSSGWTDRVSFNADNGATTKGIYGNSETVQPQATQFPYYIVLASGYKSKKSLNIDNIMNEVNSKTTLDEVYPVGSIYITANDHSSPAQIFGGTWERIEDKFLLGAGGSYAGGATGGSKNAIVVSHTHSIGFYSNSGSTNNAYGLGASGAVFGGVSNSSGTNSYLTNVNATNGSKLGNISSTGSSGINANMPPYLAVYIYQRVE